LIKYIKSVLWRVAKCLSYIEEAWCLRLIIKKVVFILLVKWRYMHSVVKLLILLEQCTSTPNMPKAINEEFNSQLTHSLPGAKFPLRCKTVAQTTKILFTFYGKWRSVTVLKMYTDSYCEPDKSRTTQHNINFKITLPSILRSCKCSLPMRFFDKKKE